MKIELKKQKKKLKEKKIELNCCKIDIYFDDNQRTAYYKPFCRYCKVEERLIYDGRVFKAEKAKNKLNELLMQAKLTPFKPEFEEFTNEKVALTFIPLKYYEPINNETQREMYANGDSTGVKHTARVKLKAIA